MDGGGNPAERLPARLSDSQNGAQGAPCPHRQQQHLSSGLPTGLETPWVKNGQLQPHSDPAF